MSEKGIQKTKANHAGTSRNISKFQLEFAARLKSGSVISKTERAELQALAKELFGGAIPRDVERLLNHLSSFANRPTDEVEEKLRQALISGGVMDLKEAREFVASVRKDFEQNLKQGSLEGAWLAASKIDRALEINGHKDANRVLSREVQTLNKQSNDALNRACSAQKEILAAAEQASRSSEGDSKYPALKHVKLVTLDRGELIVSSLPAGNTEAIRNAVAQLLKDRGLQGPTVVYEPLDLAATQELEKFEKARAAAQAFVKEKSLEGVTVEMFREHPLRLQLNIASNSYEYFDVFNAVDKHLKERQLSVEMWAHLVQQ